LSHVIRKYGEFVSGVVAGPQITEPEFHRAKRSLHHIFIKVPEKPDFFGCRVNLYPVAPLAHYYKSKKDSQYNDARQRYRQNARQISRVVNNTGNATDKYATADNEEHVSQYPICSFRLTAYNVQAALSLLALALHHPGLPSTVVRVPYRQRRTPSRFGQRKAGQN
jgi:hypothetical protein